MIKLPDDVLKAIADLHSQLVLCNRLNFCSDSLYNLEQTLIRNATAQPKCQKCGDTGMADSGGTQPCGEPILIDCDCATAQPVSDGWVKCSERMPDSEGKYLVYETLNNRVNHDYWMEPEPAEGFWNHYGTSVTHWMPLPAAPGGQCS